LTQHRQNETGESISITAGVSNAKEFGEPVMKPVTYHSFRELKDFVREQKAFEANKPSPAPVPNAAVLSDSELFETSMQDVTPLGWSNFTSRQWQPIEVPNPQESEDEGLRLLVEFLEGRVPVDLRASGEYVEGSPHPKGKRFLAPLRNGGFAVQAHLDLHGLSTAEARSRFDQFIRRSLQMGHGCIRVVHGRGHHSLDGQAVLKEQIQRWLSSRRMSRYVVAYTSARLHDGGGGALYVLLHRRR
jgi:DNA-nicking Smr family endonuclease